MYLNLNYLLQLTCTCTYTYILYTCMCMYVPVAHKKVVCNEHVHASNTCSGSIARNQSQLMWLKHCDALQHILHTCTCTLLFLCYHISPSVSIALFDVLLIPQGILDAYQYTLHNVKLHGPTNFSSFLDTAMRYASVQDSQQSQSYFILLVITVSTAGYKSTCRSCSTVYMGMYLFAHEDMTVYYCMCMCTVHARFLHIYLHVHLYVVVSKWYMYI